MNLKDTNLCECDSFYEDIDHILLKCSRFIVPRNKLFNKIISLNYEIPISIRDILAQKCFPLMKIFFEFLNEISYRV